MSQNHSQHRSKGYFWGHLQACSRAVPLPAVFPVIEKSGRSLEPVLHRESLELKCTSGKGAPHLSIILQVTLNTVIPLTCAPTKR